MPPAMIIGTTASTGTAFPMGVALGELLGKYTGSNVTAQTTSGANENIRMVSSGDADMGWLTITNLTTEAKLGVGAFEGRKIDNIRILFGALPNGTLVFTRKDSGINSIQDMKGKKIGTGPDGQYCSKLFNWLLEMHGMVGQVTEVKMPFNDAYEAVGDGDMDGMFLQGSWPNSGIMSLSTTTALNFFELSAAEMNFLMEKDPTLFRVTIPSGTYVGLDADYKTVATPTAFMANASMPDDVAYTIVKAVWEHIREYDGHSSLIPMLVPENAVQGILPEDLHPGALKYYQESNNPGLKK